MILEMNNDRFYELAKQKGRIACKITDVCKDEEHGVFAWMTTKSTPTELEVEVRFTDGVNVQNRQTNVAIKILNVLLTDGWVITFKTQPETGNRLVIGFKEDSDYIIGGR